MRKKLSVIITIVICLIPGLALADGVEVTSDDLISDAGEYNGQEIVYTGEVIGDILSRGDNVWINVSDGSNAIGVWAKTSDIQGVDTLGSYKAHGDTVRITGIFNRACAEHGGDMDIHAQSIEVIQEGYPVSHGVPVWKLFLGIALPIGAGVLMLIILRKNNKWISKSAYKKC